LCTPLVVSLLQGRERGEAREEVLAR
jgi:hypothetical protein